MNTSCFLEWVRGVSLWVRGVSLWVRGVSLWFLFFRPSGGYAGRVALGVTSQGDPALVPPLGKIGRSPETGAIELLDAKSSASAPLQPRQRSGYPLIERNGGVIFWENGGAAYPAGTPIPPDETPTHSTE